MPLLDPNQTYTFSKFFDLKIVPKDLAKEFGYSLTRTWLELPQYSQELDRLEDLRSRFVEILPYCDLSNEASRREVLISPVLLDLIHYTKSELRIEYSVQVDRQLQGYFDYLLENHSKLLVVEAKKGDLDFGFTQLVAELIALDRWQVDNPQSHFVGAVTTGTIWQFAQIDRRQQHIEQGLDSYRVPNDLDSLMRILVQSLKSDS
ncbi:hypothetical protein AY599_06060 [Leptolyngbya valderiana BDU 20041]|nr:hypothetical protein AY599_06060 [Leptolyngbya valderiana BDU 20041]